MFRKSVLVMVIAGLLMFGMSSILFAADEGALEKRVSAVEKVLPKFAIPMREVGDRFQDMYFAAKGENWALAFYMSKYMNGSMNPASLTKPAEYAVWQNFYQETFAPVNKAIYARDFKAFEKEYMAVIKSCNDCHASMGYGFIKVVKMKTPADNGIAFTGKSKAEDVPK